MFGLEGTGFTIAIAVTLLLAGIVAFYCKQRMDQLDKKLESMLNLNKALANSHAALEQRVYSGVVNMNTNVPVTENAVQSNEEFDGSNVNSVAMTDNRQVVSDDDSEEESDSDDSESDSESEDEQNLEELSSEPIAIGSELPQDNNGDGIKVVELGGDGTGNNITEELAEDLEEVELADNHEDDDDDDDDDDNEDDDESELTDLSSTDLSSTNQDLIKQIITKEVQEEVDIKKLNVAALRNLAVTRSLTDKNGAKKLKKAELLQLLS